MWLEHISWAVAIAGALVLRRCLRLRRRHQSAARRTVQRLTLEQSLRSQDLGPLPDGSWLVHLAFELAPTRTSEDSCRR